MQRIANLYLFCIRNTSVRISSTLNRHISSSFSANNVRCISVVRKIPKHGFVVVPARPATRSTVTLLAFTLAGLMKFLGLSEDEDSELVQILKRGEVELLVSLSHFFYCVLVYLNIDNLIPFRRKKNTIGPSSYFMWH